VEVCNNQFLVRRVIPLRKALQQGAHSLVSQLLHYGFTGADAGPASLGIVCARLMPKYVPGVHALFPRVDWLDAQALRLPWRYADSRHMESLLRH
jgi:hypothetical protein